MAKSARNSFETFGPPELCTWRFHTDCCRFQTTNPTFASKLAEREGATLVGYSVAGGYLRIFQERIEPWRARQLVIRYLTPTNGALSKEKRPLKAATRGERVAIAAKQQTQSCDLLDDGLLTQPCSEVFRQIASSKEVAAR